MTQAQLKIHPDAEALAQAAALRLIALIKEAIAARGRCHVALSGGSTPKRLYQLLAESKYQDDLDWSRIEIWFGDERCVPADHADSNYRMAREALFEHVALPAANIHRMEVALGQVRQAASRYANLLCQRLPLIDSMPCFDVILLGMGADGHTASLFPATCILQESTRPVAAVYVDKLQTWRVSLTYPVLNQGRHLLMLIAGADKAARIHEIHAVNPTKTVHPIQRIRARGQVEWYLDNAAAALLGDKIS